MLGKYMNPTLILFLSIIFIGLTLENKEPVTKYKIGDCVFLDAMTITDTGEWDSSAFGLASFKIVDIIKTNKMNKYMNKRLHANHFYKVQFIHLEPDIQKYHNDKRYVIPVEDLDSQRYADVFWEMEEANINNCNKYR